jgi:AcrR family transcriptional regulator
LSPDTGERIKPASDTGSSPGTRELIFETAERLFAQHGFRKVSVRDITAEAGVNLAALNYHFGSKDALLLDIFRRRTRELNRARARLLHQAVERHHGAPPVRAILAALITPPTAWLSPSSDRRTALQFIIRAAGEGPQEMREALRSDVSHLRRFAEALARARPDLAAVEVDWRLHFVLGALHNNRTVELERLSILSDGRAGALSGDADVETLIARMIDFAEAGFMQVSQASGAHD